MKILERREAWQITFIIHLILTLETLSIFTKNVLQNHIILSWMI